MQMYSSESLIIPVKGKPIDQVTEFKYLGKRISDFKKGRIINCQY